MGLEPTSPFLFRHPVAVACHGIVSASVGVSAMNYNFQQLPGQTKISCMAPGLLSLPALCQLCKICNEHGEPIIACHSNLGTHFIH